jgi:hypothetical protein
MRDGYGYRGWITLSRCLVKGFEGVGNASNPSESHLESCIMTVSNDMSWPGPYSRLIAGSAMYFQRISILET